ncbi:SRPBCC domain-containing protein [Chromobacterium subtsugae]|uniref:SRPBCC domain-containing protein n=2 Tax=Chromobacterium subtsugae TaxID=251747 RepID=UPI0007F8F35E|nr:SRPBCC domain-containing protein [Chromobacterium subtsugae]OBU87412.1 polyketide cyclase [Chromobacterium subtsugae]
MRARAIATEIDITAAHETVWQVLCDWPRYPEWNPFIVGLHGRHRLGARLVATLRYPGGARATLRPVVIELSAPQALAWRSAALMPGLLDREHRWRLEALAGGATRLHHDGALSGVLLPLCGAGIQESARRGFLLMNEALKQRCETLASAATA